MGAFTPANDRHTCVKVTPIVAGFITAPEKAYVSIADPTAKRTVPCMCFMIDHPTKRLMFDLGLRSDPRNYIPELQPHLLRRQPVTYRPSADEILRANNIAPESIEMVILSHVHWDHHGDPASFPNARFYIGKGSLSVLRDGIGHGSHAFFDRNLFEHNKHYEFSEPAIGQSILTAPGDGLEGFAATNGCEAKATPAWQSLGPFPFAADLFGDGCVYVVPAPGHLPGHLNLLCRVGDTKWVYLAADAYHDIRILTGEGEIATWEEKGETCCVHIDRKQSMESIARIRETVKMMEAENLSVEVIAAHDHIWYEKNRERFMSLQTSK